MTLNYQFAALGGHTGAQLAIGYRYMTGVDVPKSCAKAALYYELAANTAVDLLESHEGPPGVNDQHRLTNRVKKHRGGDDEEVFDYYRHAADKGDVSAQVALGQLYYYGPRGVERDLSMARRYFSVAAEKGDAVAQTNLGFMLLRGLGGPLDLNGAYSNFSAAALTGNAGAYNGLGFMYLYGVGVEADSAQAISLFNSAADQGLVEALYNLGSLYVSGVAVPRRDYTKAIHYFALGAQKGHTLSMHKLAQINLNGIGTHVSCDTAVMLFKSVAERGPWVSQLNDANTMYQSMDFKGALHAYLIAAEQGYEVAQSNAAYLLDSGVKLEGVQEEAEDVDADGSVDDGENAPSGNGHADAVASDAADGGGENVGTEEDSLWSRWDGFVKSVRESLGVPEGVGMGLHLTKEFQAIMHDVLGTPFHLPIGSRHALRLYEYAAEQGVYVCVYVYLTYS
jgi:SEL1 protein